eukprot:scaffold6142_cov257-Pinguiococcus_pyrenoidosus.AAC.2
MKKIVRKMMTKKKKKKKKKKKSKEGKRNAKKEEAFAVILHAVFLAISSPRARARSCLSPCRLVGAPSASQPRTARRRGPQAAS